MHQVNKTATWLSTICLPRFMLIMVEALPNSDSLLVQLYNVIADFNLTVSFRKLLDAVSLWTRSGFTIHFYRRDSNGLHLLASFNSIRSYQDRFKDSWRHLNSEGSNEALSTTPIWSFQFPGRRKACKMEKTTSKGTSKQYKTVFDSDFIKVP